MMPTLFDHQNTMTPTENERLAACEAVIEQGMKTVFDVGLALLEIRTSRLYRETFSTFEDYCNERWRFTRMRASQLIAAAGVFENVNNCLQPAPANEAQVRPLVQLEPEQQREAWQQAVDTAPNGKITAAHVQSVVNTFRPEVIHISDDSYEWYTPAEYIEAVRDVMGRIDLDPASCKKANETVKAETFFAKEDDGLLQDWHGRIFLNPPYNMPLVERFTARAILDYENADIEEAIVLVNNATDTKWFHSLLERYPICFTRGRVQFLGSEGNGLGPRQGQAFFYLGKNSSKFAEIFSKFGIVVCKYDHK